MNVPLSALKTKPAKYFDLANTTNIIITRRGKAIGSIVGKRSAKILAIESLIGSADFPSEYEDPNFDPNYESAREADYKARGLIE
ncbi:MAG: type II toxin-antitoxin system Phd/YefM family antitoxin [Defluviitaleaceae bacterium]|nr:type II toxin-antitoxin system Phd/YefM family antitoxin [Defluviitaleaceae bacterium]